MLAEHKPVKYDGIFALFAGKDDLHFIETRQLCRGPRNWKGVHGQAPCSRDDEKNNLIICELLIIFQSGVDQYYEGSN
jgi:hypothetical protein